MRIKVKPTENLEKLKENLEKRVESIEASDGELVVKGDRETIERTPGVEKFRIEGETYPGLKGSPVDENAYAELESREDAVKALLATIQGFNLVVLDTDREWDLRQLRKYNPDIKQLKSDGPVEELGIDRSLSGIGDTEEVEVEMPDEEEAETIYREMLT